MITLRHTVGVGATLTGSPVLADNCRIALDSDDTMRFDQTSI